MGNISEMAGVGFNIEHAKALIGTKALTVSAAGTVQGDATELTAACNLVTTVASGAGVVITSGYPEDSQMRVFNGGANALKIYPPSGGAINNGSANAAISLQAGDGVVLARLSSTVWGAIFTSLADANNNLGAINVTSISIGTSGSEVTLAATPAEIDAKADRSAQVVSLTGTDAITQTEHESRVNIITGTTAATYTLPEATGSGDRYKFIFAEVNTNGTVFVTADTANCDIRGSLNILDADSNAQTAYPGNASDDTITLNGTTTGGQIGDWIEFVDIATDVWHVMGQLVCPTGSNVADMFSSAA